MALAIGVTFVSNIQYNVRYVIICYPALMILLALGINRAFEPGRIRWVIAIAATALVASMIVALGNWYGDPTYAKEEVRPLARLMVADRGDTLWVTDNARIIPPLAYYGVRARTGIIGPDDAVAGEAPLDILRRLNVRACAGLPASIAFVSFRSWEIAGNAAIRNWVEAHGALAGKQDWAGVTLTRYRAIPRKTVAC
jgi:hypothetical protein